MFTARRWLLLTGFMAVMALLLWRAMELQLLRNDFLRNHGDARSLRVVTVHAHRGAIVDRNNEPLAISTPVKSVWAVPHKVLTEGHGLQVLAAALGMEVQSLKKQLEDRIGREFVYLKRHVTPDQARAIQSLSIPGVHLQQEYKRYYPAGEVTAHIIGFTNVDDVGQEGMELAYDHWLRGSPGSKRVLKDRLGHIVQDVESIHSSDPGKQLTLSIDQRVQYLAYRELKTAVTDHNAHGGMLVMLDAKTGEVMALVGQPSYNPNNRSGMKSNVYRNRIVTDVFEPGSTMKPFTIAAALLSGMYQPGTRIDTQPGYFKVNGHAIRDARNYGDIDVSTVIRKSSNVGAGKIALSLGPRKIWEMFSNIGFGRDTGSGFPGESAGILNNYRNWSELELATIAFGYGVSVTALQLAHAYSIIAAEGLSRPVSFLKVDKPLQAKRIIPAVIARQVKDMIEAVVMRGGTGQRAAVKGYRVAGKTGTVHKSSIGGYAEDRYMSLFSGMAPASDPRLVLVVIIDEPQGSEYYGGQVAAPVFSRVMKGALRILNVPPDDLSSTNGQIIMAHNSDPLPWNLK
ncbi:MAG: peptidoglycan D,D-transpeptidase FtsI family protein [Gammaproteobacteria bacterium]